MAPGHGRKYIDRTAASDSVCIYAKVVYQWNRRRYGKRIVSALLVCVLGMSLVTGCGNNAKAAETTKTADGKIQLDLWYSGGKTAVNVFQDIVDAFNESQDKYEVKTTTQADYTETYEKLQAGIAGKKAPDMALLDTDKSRNLSEKIWLQTSMSM